MPEMNGFETTEHIRNTLKSQIPIIALSADVTTADVAKCKAVGMDDYIAKPVDERILYSKIIGLVKKTKYNKQREDGKNESIQLEKLKYINLDYLVKRTKANPVLMMQMIAIYLEQTPPLVLAMKQSLHDEDWELLEAAVHKIIPSFLIMGINEDFEMMARKVHEYAISREQTEIMHDLVLQIEMVCISACSELEEELKRIKNTKL